MTQDEAKILQQQVNTILQRMTSENVPVRGAINWADLKCSAVVECHSMLDGDNYVMVLIEEASPDATELQAFVKEQLDNAGFEARFGMPVAVETEW